MFDGLSWRRWRRRCGWYGSHFGQVGVGVDIGWPCGHISGPSTPTCTAHLDYLLSQGGKASKARPCPICGVRGSAKVVGTRDLTAVR